MAWASQGAETTVVERMSCERVSQLVRGELADVVSAPGEAAAGEAHFGACEPCRDRARPYLLLSELLDDYAERNAMAPGQRARLVRAALKRAFASAEPNSPSTAVFSRG